MKTVGRHHRIDFVDTPWPISILAFNQAVSEMKPGDHMIAFLKDADVMAGLLQLLRHQPDVTIINATSHGDFCIEVKKETNRGGLESADFWTKADC